MINKNLIDRIKQHEGYRQIPYRDTLGYWTVGYGHCLIWDNVIPGESVGAMLNRITDQEQHNRWLIQDIEKAQTAVQNIFGTDLYAYWHESVRDVLVEMAFQLGEHGLDKFLQMKAAIIAQKWDRAADEMLNSKWAQQTPNRAQSLAEIMRNGRER